MYCTAVFDLDLDKVVNYWWSSTPGEAHTKRDEFAVEYADRQRYEIYVELNCGPCATIHDACGY